jgi:hypothetical protein
LILWDVRILTGWGSASRIRFMDAVISQHDATKNTVIPATASIHSASVSGKT